MADQPNQYPSARLALAPAAREAAIERLTSAFAHDLLPLDEFEHRVAAAYRASSPTELAELTADIPLNAPAGRSVEATSANPTRMAAVFSNVERGGAVDVPAHVELRALFGNLELDLRQARFAPGITEITIRSLFGNVEVLLPADVAVENDGEGVLANFTCRSTGLNPYGVIPVAQVRIHGRAVLSSVEVR